MSATPEPEVRVTAVTTGSPEVQLLACVLCGVLLWDIDAHYTHAHRGGSDCGHPNHGGDGHECGPFTVSPLATPRTDVREAVARAIFEAERDAHPLSQHWPAWPGPEAELRPLYLPRADTVIALATPRTTPADETAAASPEDDAALWLRLLRERVADLDVADRQLADGVAWSVASTARNYLTALAASPAGETASDLSRAARVAHDRLMWSARVNGYGRAWEAMTPDERDGWVEYVREIIAASPADADTADGLDPEVAARWASCDRAEAIRQAERFHAEMLRWSGRFDQMREERDALRDDAEQVAQAIERLAADAARIAREHAASQPVAATSEEESS